MSLVWIATLSLGGIGAISAIILYLVAQKFKVYEDPRNGQVEAVLPGANCGGCAILGMEAGEVTPKVAVVRCNGNCANRKKTNHYDGASSCAIEAALYSGETGCSYGCLGNGDCENACSFGAIRINPETRLPEVDEELCTACGACVKACPKGIIELRNKGPKSRRMFVSCVNKDKGAVARKACSAACIGCGKCAKECPFDAITITNNLAYIDFQKCRLCRKCEAVCPTGAIHSVNFPPRKPVEAKTDAPKPVEPKNETAPTEKPATPDKVKVGTLLAQAGGFVSANIHSPVSGTVSKIDTAIDAAGFQRPAIIIDVEGDEWEESIDRSETLVKECTLDAKAIIDRIKECGIVGLGGNSA